MDATITHALITNPVLIFFTVLVIILMAPLLLTRLKIPQVVGLIIAGVIVGPYGLNLLERDSSFEIFGQVGLLYLMFLAGLEIDMFHLKKNIRKGLGFGLLTFLIPLILGTLASVTMLHLGWITAILVASMYASHTLIAYPVVTRFGITKSPAVLITIVGTIVAVLGSLLVLGVVVGIQSQGEFAISNILRLLLNVAIYCAAILYLYPRIMRWFFKTFSDSVTQFVFVLALVFLASWLAKVVGLESVLGAFFAGLVLNRYVPNISPLMNRIEFVGNALFIPYFLIGVGMMINIRVMSSTDTMVVAGNMLLVAISTKWIAAYIAQKINRFTRNDRSIMFGLSSAHTAVALAVVTLGYNMLLPDGSHALSEAVMNGTIVMILVTCTMAPIVTSGAAAKMKIRMMEHPEDYDEEKRTEKKQMRTLIPVANPVTASSLVTLALLMKRKTTDDSIFALHVRNDNSSSSVAIGRNALKLAGETAAAVNVTMQTIERYDLNTSTGIINTVKERNITDIVVGMHQHSNIVDSFFGSKIEQLLKELNNMVIISRCFIPINTITRIVVVVPEKAEFETGFEAWIIRVTNLAMRIGCRIIFCAYQTTIQMIHSAFKAENIEVRSEFREVKEWGDLVLIANNLLDDDLMILIGARRASVSFNPEMDTLPNFLAKYFARNNLLVIFPEQFGETPKLTRLSNQLSADITATPSGAWLRLRAWFRWLNTQKKRITHRNRKKRTFDL
jgi:Kef-type K+ transport system membrane component KefB/nucleotide-binding universal stress UspA family protein